MQTPVFAQTVVHEVADADHIFEGVPMAQAIPIYPFPNGFVPASGAKISFDNDAPAAEPVEDDGAASTPTVTSKKAQTGEPPASRRPRLPPRAATPCHQCPLFPSLLWRRQAPSLSPTPSASSQRADGAR